MRDRADGVERAVETHGRSLPPGARPRGAAALRGSRTHRSAWPPSGGRFCFVVCVVVFCLSCLSCFLCFEFFFSEIIVRGVFLYFVLSVS